MSEAGKIHLLRSPHDARACSTKPAVVEVYSHAPIGYVKSPNGELALDADEQVKGVVRLIFEQFERQGTVCAVLRCLVRHQIFPIPVRPIQKQFRGQLQWHRPEVGLPCRTCCIIPSMPELLSLRAPLSGPT